MTWGALASEVLTCMMEQNCSQNFVRHQSRLGPNMTWQLSVLHVCNQVWTCNQSMTPQYLHADDMHVRDHVDLPQDSILWFCICFGEDGALVHMHIVVIEVA